MLVHLGSPRETTQISDAQGRSNTASDGTIRLATSPCLEAPRHDPSSAAGDARPRSLDFQSVAYSECSSSAVSLARRLCGLAGLGAPSGIVAPRTARLESWSGFLGGSFRGTLMSVFWDLAQARKVESPGTQLCLIPGHCSCSRRLRFGRSDQQVGYLTR